MARNVFGTFAVADVDSHSKSGVKYKLTLTGEVRCSCPDSTYRDRDCKHVREFVASLRAKATAKIQRRINNLRNEADRLEQEIWTQR